MPRVQLPPDIDVAGVGVVLGVGALEGEEVVGDAVVGAKVW